MEVDFTDRNQVHNQAGKTFAVVMVDETGDSFVEFYIENYRQRNTRNMLKI